MATGPLSARLRQLRYMIGLLRYDEPQTLTTAQRNQARANIGAADASTAALAARRVNAGTALIGGGDMTQDRTINADIATQAEAQAGDSNVKLMTPQRTAQAIDYATIGRGQSWQNPSRVAGVTYQNNTGAPIAVSIFGTGSATRDLRVSAKGSNWVVVGVVGGDDYTPGFTIVPAGHYYRLEGPMTGFIWSELR